jgi:putative FmdB family regulatory protein
MPLYEFRCQTCGEFEAWRKLAEVSQPMHCPTCDAIAKRIFSPPSINLNSGSLSRIGDSAEPKVVQRQQEPAQPRYQTAASSRPWMIGHAPPRY